MEISINYCRKTNNINLVLDDASLYKNTIKELEEIKESFSDDIDVNIVIDELNKTFVAKSKTTNNTFRGHYTYLDADEICFIYHEVAIMDDVVIFIEEFCTK